MIVLDASVVVHLLLNTSLGAQVQQRIAAPELTLHAPQLLDLEVVQVLRRYALTGQLSPKRAAEALQDLADLDVARHDHPALVPRIWELRDNLTAYDATYVALAEVLDATLLTADSPLARAPGHRARVEVVEAR